MKKHFLALLALLTIPVSAQQSPSESVRVFNKSIGFSASTVSGFGMTYEANLTRNFSTQFLVGGVAQKSNSDFNAGLSTKYVFSRLGKYVGIYALMGGNYFYDRNTKGIYDEETNVYGPEHSRKYIRAGAGFGIKTLFFGGRLGLDVNYIGLGASYEKKENEKKFDFGDNPVRGPQVTVSYHF
ncbi:MAG: hypothetical protein KDC45_07980 [Bacteroidetes bacterium]|nr:hypothetical protein [Bacteroidota bacterium]